MIIRLPWGEPIDTNNVPTNFEEVGKKSFGKFTEGTYEEYRAEDKLLYIDNLRSCYLYPHDINSNDGVRDLMHEMLDYKLDECDDFVEKEDFLNFEFMERCYEAGDRPLYKHMEGVSGSTDHRIQELVLEIVKIVVNYE